MAQLKNILQELVISNQVGANYSDLNAAMASGGTIKTYKIESPVTLTASITFAVGSTLIIGSQGSISGAFTLTGNNTTLSFEAKNNAVASNVIFAGSWRGEDIDVVNFNIVADGITDDTTALQKAFTLANLTTSKRIRINGTFKVVSILIGNTTIIGNPKFIGTAVSCALSGVGTCGTFYNLDADALVNSCSITCSNATLLASLVDGDVINITSSLEYADSCSQGEIFEITSISGSTIYFKEPLHETYLLSDTCKIARITPNTSRNIGLISIEFPIDTTGDLQIDKYTYGIQITYGKNNDFNISCLKTSSRGIVFLYCYKPRVVYRGTQGECAGYGYGVSIAGATMYADVTGFAEGYRHCVTHGGSTNGVPWESHIHDFYGVGILVNGATVYDTHPSTGSVVFSNCIATSNGTVNGGLCGFTTNGRNVKMINCEARNVYVGAMLTDPTSKQVSIVNFRCINTNLGVQLGSYAVCEYLELKNITHINDTLKTGTTLELAQGEIHNINIENIISHNVNESINYGAIINSQTTLVLRNITATSDSDTNGVAVRLANATVTTLIIAGLITKNHKKILEVATAVGLCSIRDFHIENPSEPNMINFTLKPNIVDINEGSILNPVTANSCIVSLLQGVDSLKITNVIGNGVNLDHITKVVSGKPFTNFFHNGNIIVNALDSIHETQTPTNTIIDGSVGM